MELSDRETLIKLEQQLQNLNDNHQNIKDAQKVIFEKIDKNSKEIFGLKSKLHTVVETSALRKEQLDTKVDENADDINKVNSDITKIKEDSEVRKTFESEIKGSLKILKWLIGLGMLAVAILQLIAFIYFSKGS